jgi:hypothetical protein
MERIFLDTVVILGLLDISVIQKLYENFAGKLGSTAGLNIYILLNVSIN